MAPIVVAAGELQGSKASLAALRFRPRCATYTTRRATSSRNLAVR